MFTTRLITAAVLLTVFSVALAFLPNAYWSALLLVGLVVASAEWSRLAGFRRVGRGLFPLLVLVSGVALLCALRSDAVATTAQAPIQLSVYWISAAFWVVAAPVWLFAKWRIRNSLVMAITGWILLVPAWLALTALQTGPARLFVLLGVVWIADTAAYGCGRLFGHHRLAPRISPGKTWEGVFGACAAVAVYYGVVWFIFGSPQHTASLLPGAVLFAVVFVMSVQGDLFESWMKRQAGVKDSGTLFPGHGGLLDRVDGLTASMPLAALWVHYFGFPVLL